ncbi:hypothetical protein KABACHOK_02250 [Brevundimonas phage vB_BpoS-Kabachok]|uniref:Uncharacterized protein n=1 Tax=Brevundimonas phage vB_BpoS-Kabachok TaxID=2948600 RepID=A0A9E7MQV6_9CAUD|nr:hypothetical protein KABACHOK_02250 [Brevundimonas phage vB_BpoS-Kabachok]
MSKMSAIAPITPQDRTIHVNRGTIDSNRKHAKNDPPLKLSRGRSSIDAEYGHEIELWSGAGDYIGRFVYDPAGILPCGAKALMVLAPGVVTKVKALEEAPS